MCMNPRLSPQHHIRPGMMVLAYYPYPQEVDRGGRMIEFRAILGYMGHCSLLKNAPIPPSSHSPLLSTHQKDGSDRAIHWIMTFPFIACLLCTRWWSNRSKNEASTFLLPSEDHNKFSMCCGHFQCRQRHWSAHRPAVQTIQLHTTCNSW